MQIKNKYPRPQLERDNWQNLNGEWQFSYDDEDCGLKEKWYKNEKRLDKTILVPFVYQAPNSGIGDKTPHDIVWYKREFSVKKLDEKPIVILHFGAVDYEAQIFVNEHLVKQHTGGHTPFFVDITEYLTEDIQTLTVRAADPHFDELIPRGKQFWEKESRGIWYTNSTGIWQTVWIECVAKSHINKVRFTSLFDEGKVNIQCEGCHIVKGYTLNYHIALEGQEVCQGEVSWADNQLSIDVDLIQNHIFRTNFHDDGWSWTPEHPKLFDVELSLTDENKKVLDLVKSYFGFRKVHTENGMVYLNNKPYYQKLILDQGYWQEGLLTAPDDEAIKKDIELAKEMGFNGCRKHQKIEDPRFLYWADHMGYLVWGECASAPMYSAKAAKRLMEEWSEAIDRDYNHPCIIVWVPLNESWGVPNIHQCRTQQHFSQAMYHYLHSLDNTRLVISNDGWEMTETDICAIHNYMHGQKQETKKYQEFKTMLSTKETLIKYSSTCWDIYANGFEYKGEPILLTEFGGIGFDVSGEAGWGYTSVKNEEEFLADYERIMDAVYVSQALWGFCYTQLTDVEQEINGLLTYKRKPKCDLQKIKRINKKFHRNRVIL